MIIDGIALRNKERFSALANPGATWQIPTIDGFDSTPFIAGSIAVVCQVAENTSATIPTSVTPAGWTLLNSNAVTGSSGLGTRMNTFIKLLTAADIGVPITGMNGASKNRVAGMVLQFNRPITAITNVSDAADLLSGLPATQTATWNSVPGAHLYFGCAHGDANVADANFTWTSGPTGSAYVYSTAAPDLGPVSATRTWYSFFPIGVNPTASVGMVIGSDTGDFNGVSAMLLRLS